MSMTRQTQLVSDRDFADKGAFQVGGAEDVHDSADSTCL